MTISGTVTLADSTIIDITDANIVQGSVSITMSTCREGKYDFGTFNAATLKIGIIDDDALQHDFAGALIRISVIEIEGGEEVQTDLGEYTVDAKQTKREKNAVKLTATDRTAAFDTEIDETYKAASDYTALVWIQTACRVCGVNLYGNAIPENSPNAAVTFGIKNAAIQTWRDVVMWACQLISANAIINRFGMLEIRRAWYIFDAQPDFTCTAADRSGITFSDTRVYLKYMTAYSGNAVKTYVSSAAAPSQSRAGSVSLAKNPLLDGKTESECDTINAAILGKNYVQRQIKAKMFGNPTIALGDLGAFSGGKIDVRRSVRGIVTGITWKYRGIMTVTCTAPTAVDE